MAIRDDGSRRRRIGNQLNSPNSAEMLDNGDILIADQSNNRAIEVTRSHRIVATFSARRALSAPWRLPAASRTATL